MISFTGAAIAAFVAASLLTLAILWPFRLGISLSAAEFFQIVDEREAEAGASVTESEALRELALARGELRREPATCRVAFTRGGGKVAPEK